LKAEWQNIVYEVVYGKRFNYKLQSSSNSKMQLKCLFYYTVKYSIKSLLFLIVNEL